MALLARQQQDIIFYLGWPGRTLIKNSTSYNSRIASSLLNLNVEIESQVLDLLDQISALEDILAGAAVNRLAAKQVGDIQMNLDEMSMLRKERRILINRLSGLLDIPSIGGSGMMVGLIV